MTMHICNDQETHITLEFTDNQPFILYAEPFIGPRQVHLKISQGCANALCAYLHHDTEAFTVPLCVTSFNQIPCKSYFLLTQNLEDQDFTVFFASRIKTFLLLFAALKKG